MDQMDIGNYTFLEGEKRRMKKKKQKKILYICSVLVAGVCLGTLLFWLINGKSFKAKGGGGTLPVSTCSSVPDSEKFDCHPDRPISESECLKRGCCYQPASDLHVSDQDLIYSSYVGVPSCFYSKEFKGYDVKRIGKNMFGISAVLRRKIPSGFPRDVQEVKVDIEYMDNQRLRISLKDSEAKRFEPNIPLNYYRNVNQDKLSYTVDLNEDGLLTVTRNATGGIVFKTKLSQLIYSDLFLQLSTYTASSNLFGLGEQKEGLLRSFNWTRYTLFNQGDLPVPHRNLYGSHPFYLLLEPDGNANGVFLRNSNAMDAILQPAPAITFRPIGGILDFFILMGPTPADVVKQYIYLIGEPFMIPYWSLGFQLSRYGYFTLNKTGEALQRNLDQGVRIDVQWHDIDFMNRYLDFTYDPVKFEGLPEWVEELHEKDMHYIAMISPGVSNTEPPNEYPPYDDGVELDLFVKDTEGKYIEAKVWNLNYTVYPDFSNPATPTYWAKLFKDYYVELKYDGIWLDMNEPTSFLNGSVNGCEKSEYDNPPYLPGRPYPLSTMTICMTAQHNTTIHYNEHNLVSFREARATFEAIQDIRKKRPFIISRASFSGQGVYSGHWSGDITSDWEDMRYTIPFMLLFNMYGMPMVGSDICGFRLNTTEELCARWQALGAFYPFSRNHNDFDTIDQDPAAMGPIVLKATVDNLHTRYYLLPYFYTLFYRSHIYAETAVRPLFFEFPNDPNVYNNNEEFLWGPALLIIPALYEGVNEVNAYYPEGVWYNFHTGEKFLSTGENRTLPTNITAINLAVRGGFILPLQIPGNTTAESRKNAFDLLAALDENMEAVGFLYWDDGESVDSFQHQEYTEIYFSVKNNTFHSIMKFEKYYSVMKLNEIKIYGIEKGPFNVTINGNSVDYEYTQNYLKVDATNYTLLEELNVVWNSF